MKNRGPKDESTNQDGKLGFVHDTKPLVALVECGFIDNEEDRKFYTSDEGITKIAKGIVRGLLGYIGEDWKPELANPVIAPPPPFGDNLELEKNINELSEKVVDTVNQVNTLNDKVGEVIRKIDDIQTDITTIYKDRDTLALIQNKITENTNSINGVQVAASKVSTELKSEIRTLGESEDSKLVGLGKRITAIEKGQTIESSKFEFIKKLWGRFYIVKVK
jgi:regulator of replication initiation timing